MPRVQATLPICFPNPLYSGSTHSTHSMVAAKRNLGIPGACECTRECVYPTSRWRGANNTRAPGQRQPEAGVALSSPPPPPPPQIPTPNQHLPKLLAALRSRGFLISLVPVGFHERFSLGQSHFPSPVSNTQTTSCWVSQGESNPILSPEPGSPTKELERNKDARDGSQGRILDSTLRS